MLSLKYQVMSKQTAIIGVLKTKKKSSMENIKVEINRKITLFDLIIAKLLSTKVVRRKVDKHHLG